MGYDYHNEISFALQLQPSRLCTKKKETNENKKILPALAPMSMEHMPTAMFVHEQLVDSLEDFARCWRLIP